VGSARKKVARKTLVISTPAVENLHAKCINLFFFFWLSYLSSSGLFLSISLFVFCSFFLAFLSFSVSLYHSITLNTDLNYIFYVLCMSFFLILVLLNNCFNCILLGTIISVFTFPISLLSHLNLSYFSFFISLSFFFFSTFYARPFLFAY